MHLEFIGPLPSAGVNSSPPEGRRPASTTNSSRTLGQLQESWTACNLPIHAGVDHGIDTEAIDYDGAWKETLERFLPCLIHWLLALPEPEELTFRQELRKLQQETSMPYISTYDRLVREEGRQEGRQEGQIAALREVLLEGLTQRFGHPSDALLSPIAGVREEAQLRRMVGALFTASSVESFAKAIAAD